MKDHFLSITLCAISLTAQAQLSPTARAPLRDHLLEVNKQWRVMDPAPEGGERIVRFDNDAQRIAVHLHRVAAHLRAHAPEGLPASAMANRTTLLDRLDAYADRGLFPQNHVLPYRNPVFIDPKGTACAVGQLMIESGDRALAERISREMNLYYVLDMKREDAFGWAVTNGFTEQELAWIQPAYSPNHDWLPLGGGTDGTVTTLHTLSNGDLLVAGDLTTAGGTACTQVARWNGTDYQAMGGGVDGVITCAIEFNGELYLGGAFQAGFADLAHWTGTSWDYENVFFGKYVQVNDLHVFNGALYAAGYTMGFAGATHMVAKKNGANWDPVGSAFNDMVRALEDRDDELVAGGDFTSMISPMPVLAQRVARFTGSDWSQLADGLNAPVHDLHDLNGDLYAGGECRVDSLPTFGLARLGPAATAWEMMMPNQTGYLDYFDGACRVNTIDDANGELFVGGSFTLLGLMYYGNNLMRFWGTPDAFDAWALNDGAVLDIEQRANQLVMAGEFQNDQFTPVPHIGSTDLVAAIGEGPALPPFSVSPNPASDHVVVRIDGTRATGTTVDVLDAAGRVVIAPTPVNASVTRLDVSALPKGTYVLRLTTAGAVGTRSFVRN